jgi:hypothetical protein
MRLKKLFPERDFSFPQNSNRVGQEVRRKYSNKPAFNFLFCPSGLISLPAKPDLSDFRWRLVLRRQVRTKSIFGNKNDLRLQLFRKIATRLSLRQIIGEDFVIFRLL